jgi:hypothetical protein
VKVTSAAWAGDRTVLGRMVLRALCGMVVVSPVLWLSVL